MLDVGFASHPLPKKLPSKCTALLGILRVLLNNYKLLRGSSCL